MAFPDFGGPLMSETVPHDTATTDRESRDIEQRGVENKYTAAQGNVRDGSAGVLVQVATGATGGRKDREYLERGGEDHLTYNPADWFSPTVTVEAGGRNNRLYADPTTGTSALGGGKSQVFDEGNNNTGLYPF